MKKIIFTMSLAVLLLTFPSCAKKDLPSRTELVLGTVCTISLFEAGTKTLYDNLFDRLRDIEGKMSANREDTEIAAINAEAGIRPVAVSTDTFSVLRFALSIAEESGGAFDPTVGPLTKLWNIGFEDARVPAPAEIDAVLPLIDYRQLELDEKEKTAFLRKKGMKIDLGAIAKGYSADALALILKDAGVKSAIIDLGGNIYAYGSRSDGQKWRVGIKNPNDPAGPQALRADVINKSVVTSGIYERYIEQDGKRYHHILNPKTGYSVWNGITSFTIISQSSTLADALSTTCFVLGVEKGLAFAEKFENVQAVCMTAENKLLTARCQRGDITILRNEFSLIELTQ